MKLVMIYFGGVAFLTALVIQFIVTSETKSAIHEIEALILVVIAAICLVGAGIIHHVERIGDRLSDNDDEKES